SAPILMPASDVWRFTIGLTVRPVVSAIHTSPSGASAIIHTCPTDSRVATKLLALGARLNIVFLRTGSLLSPKLNPSVATQRLPSLLVHRDHTEDPRVCSPKLGSQATKWRPSNRYNPASVPSHKYPSGV